MKKHVAKLRNTDQRCVVVFLQVPGKESHALVVNTETLPPRFEQNLMEILESPEGQAVQDLGTVLGRRIMPDSKRDFLSTLHEAGLLRSEPVSNIIMYPLPNMPFPLDKILLDMGKSLTPTTPQEPEAVKYNPYVENQKAAASETNLMMAKNKIVEAQMLEGEAKRKREEAYKLAPELRPQVVEDRKVYTIDVGDMTPEKAASLLNEFRETTDASHLHSTEPTTDASEPVKRKVGRPRKHPA